MHPNDLWSSIKVKMFSTIGTCTSLIGIITFAIGLYCKCFQNKMSCVPKHHRLTTLPTNDTHVELQPIMNSIPDISDQLSPQPVHKIFKVSGVDLSKFEHYKQCKTLHQTTGHATELSIVYKHFIFFLLLNNVLLWLITS